MQSNELQDWLNFCCSLLIPSPLLFNDVNQYESYYDHTFHPDKSSLTWTLDYDKTSDFDDVAGHWHVEPSKQPACSRVYYACDIQMKGKVPGPGAQLHFQSRPQAGDGLGQEGERSAPQQDDPQGLWRRRLLSLPWPKSRSNPSWWVLVVVAAALVLHHVLADSGDASSRNQKLLLCCERLHKSIETRLPNPDEKSTV